MKKDMNISKEMCSKHMVYRCLMFTVFEDEQPILVGVY